MNSFSLPWGVPVTVVNPEATPENGQPERLEFVLRKPSSLTVSRIQFADRRRQTIGFGIQGSHGEVQQIVEKRLGSLAGRESEVEPEEVIKALKDMVSETGDGFDAIEAHMGDFDKKTIEFASMLAKLVIDIRNPDDPSDSLQMPWGGTWSDTPLQRQITFANTYLPLFKAAFELLVGDAPSEEEREKPSGQAGADGGTASGESTPA